MIGLTRWYLASCSSVGTRPVFLSGFGIASVVRIAYREPAGRLTFAALRCATDNLNGDNVEYVFFPAGVKHVFCYELLVNPAPTSGLITIEKQVIGGPAGEHPAFPFSGNISYDPNGFQLSDGGSVDFYRAGVATWNAAEGTVAGYQRASVDCTATSEPREDLRRGAQP